MWSIYVVDQLLFCIVSSILTFDFHLIWGSFLTFLGPYWAIFGVRVGFKNCFVVYICRWPTFIFYSFFNSDFWFSLDFGSFLTFLGPYWAIFGVGVGFKNRYGVFLYRLTTFVFRVFLYFCSIMKFWVCVVGVGFWGCGYCWAVTIQYFLLICFSQMSNNPSRRLSDGNVH